MKWINLLRLGRRSQWTDYPARWLTEDAATNQRQMDDLARKILHNPGAQLAKVERRIIAALRTLGLRPPFDEATLADEIVERLAEKLQIPVLLRPNLRTGGRVSGLVVLTREGIVVSYAPSDDPRTEFLSKLHELSHVLLKHRIKRIGALAAVEMQSPLLRDVDDLEAEQAAAVIWRHVVRDRLSGKSPFEQLLED